MGVFDNIISRVSKAVKSIGSKDVDDFISPVSKDRTAEGRGFQSPLPGGKKAEPSPPSPVQFEQAQPTQSPTPAPGQPLDSEDIAVKESQPAGFPEAEDVAKAVRDFYTNAIPNSSQSVNEYFPIGEFLDDMVINAERQRPGAGALIALQGFFESTGGRATNNLFGVKPGGQTSSFHNLEDSIDYQLSPSVLASKNFRNMNVLNEDNKAPLTTERIRRLYDSYDPPGAYLDSLLDAFEAIKEFKSS